MSITQQILDLQKDAYADRIGKVYGDLEVLNVEYDWAKRKQLWTMRCKLCGETRKTYNGYEYAKSKNSGICRCRGRSIKAEKIQKKKKEALDLPSAKKWIGKTYGEWEVIGYAPGRGWKVKCVDCGRETYHPVAQVKSFSAPKCLCKFNYGKYGSDEWIGKRYGSLTITEYKNRYFICKCDCGAKTRVKPTHLISGTVKTCGECEFHNEVAHIHGQSGTRLYNIWSGMKDRCYNSKNESFRYYGGRGISVCDKWRNDVVSFVTWANENGYSEDLSIDRINGDGNYEPSNCRWATAKEQANNKHPKYTFTERPDVIVHKRKIKWAIDGETKSAIEWCEQYNMRVPVVMYRIRTMGMSPKQALTEPKKREGRPRTAGVK